MTRRQRATPPADRWSARRLEAGGGIETADPKTLAAGLGTELARYPGDAFDGQVQRDRGPFMAQPHYTPAAQAWVNWTEAGPLRPELHMRNVTLRTLVGNTRSRFPYVQGTPTGGMHTMGPAGVERTLPRYVQTPQMTYARVNRLSPGQYAGQTYSQTTALQGAGRRAGR